LSDSVSTILVVVLIVMVLALGVFLQGWRTRRSPFGRVVGIAKDVRHNEKLCENHDQVHVVGRFRTGAWDKYSESVDFLPQELKNDLADLFRSISGLNETINTAGRLGSSSYISSSDVEKLKAPLTSCRDKLQEWVHANINNPEYLPRKWGLFRR
jgi:hypothetical protein